MAPFPLKEDSDEDVILPGEELVEISVAVDFLVGLPGPVLPLVAVLVVSSVAFLVLVWAGEIVVEDDALVCVDGVTLSSPPRLDLLDATLTVADAVVDVHNSLPFDVGGIDVGTAVVLSAAAAKAAVCFRADRLSLAVVPASWVEIPLFACSLNGSSNADFLVLLGLGEALETGLDPLDVDAQDALDFEFFPPWVPFVKL